MAQGKKSFLLYADITHTIEHLTNEEKGVLFQHLLDYVNDKNPKLDDRFLLVAWTPIERQLKRDLKRYEETIEKRSNSGILGNLKRWNADLYNKVVDGEINLKEAESIAKHRKTSQSDSTPSHPIAKIAVNVNDNVNDINNIYNKFLDDVKNHKFDARVESIYMRLKLKEKTLTPLLLDFKNHIIEKNRVHKNTEEFFNNFGNWLNTQDRIGKLKEYKN